eukprot:10758120-Lingulodinium_polyedra.AAC.4
MGAKKAPASTNAETSSPAKKGRVVTFEAAVSRKIYDNYRDLTPQETDATLDSEGRTLRQLLSEHMALNARCPGSVTMGATYHANNRKVFSRKAKDHEAAREALNETEIRPSLLKASALSHMLSITRVVIHTCSQAHELSSLGVAVPGQAMLAATERHDRGLMLKFVQVCDGCPNLVECQGILRWMLGLRLQCSEKQLPAALKACEFLSRCRAQCTMHA